MAKAQPVSARNPQALVLGADTIVVLDGRILGKPADAQEAADMLRALSGKEHEVTTVVALLRNGQEAKVFSETTKVRFRQLSEAEVVGYVATGSPWIRQAPTGFRAWEVYLYKASKVVIIMLWGCPCPGWWKSCGPLASRSFLQVVLCPGVGKGA